ncbi:hypothetical protein MLD38_001295 [Melastoma candidum]|uniref:Uncharacterized protein n=1 Tax=Melastoma candidum TaxID=119954 RepID=A0ACB9SDS3_9MYRT|nr:hypothetical protein MLD38_001295 [Melastoma candidum]
MAYHHHHHHSPPPTAAAPSCYCCYSSPQTHIPAPHPPQQPAQPDPLLVDAVVSRLLYLHSYQTPIKPQTHHAYPQYRPLGKTLDLSSLVDRIEALEASLLRFSCSAGSVVSVRDAAARVIQQHFRAFLVRRSRILRQLQDLAIVKSSYVALRSSVSSSSYLRFGHISRKVEDLLLQLDSIEEDDPMISEGKKSISRNLDRFLRYVNERSNDVLPTRSNSGQRTGSKGRKDDVTLRAQKEIVNDLRGRVKRIQKMSRVLEKGERGGDVDLEGFDDFSDLEEKKHGVPVIGGIRSLRNGAKKSVKFVKNGDAYKVISNSDEQSSPEEENDSGNDSVDVSDKFKKVDVKESPKDEEQGQDNSGGLHSDGSDVGARGEHRGRYARYVFTPPVPEKMESAADSLMRKKKEEKL